VGRTSSGPVFQRLDYEYLDNDLPWRITEYALARPGGMVHARVAMLVLYRTALDAPRV
jgi:hypothetical protein